MRNLQQLQNTKVCVIGAFEQQEVTFSTLHTEVDVLCLDSTKQRISAAATAAATRGGRSIRILYFSESISITLHKC